MESVQRSLTRCELLARSDQLDALAVSEKTRGVSALGDEFDHCGLNFSPSQ